MELHNIRYTKRRTRNATLGTGIKKMAPFRGPVGLVLIAVEFEMESYTCIDSYSLGGGA